MTKTGKPSLPAEPLHINLRVLAEAMERTGGFFDAVEAEIEERLSYKAEALAMSDEF